MPSTYTSGLRLINQADGENAYTWGQLADLNFEFLDDALTRVLEIDLTGSSSKTLTVNNGADDEARSAVLKLKGIPTSANSVIIPACEKTYGVDTTFTSVTGGITIRTAAGTGVNFLTGQKGFIYCDGVSVRPLTQLTSSLNPADNLSDLTNVSIARDNLGLNVSAFATVSANNLQFLYTSGTRLEFNFTGLLNLIWPVGSLYSNRTDGTNPGTLMNFGTWTSAGLGRVPVGVGLGIDSNGVSAFISAQSCGGEYVHVLTTAEMTKHSHVQIGRTGGGGGAMAMGTGETNVSVNNTGEAGSSQPFNIQQPWYSVYQWIRTA